LRKRMIQVAKSPSQKTYRLIELIKEVNLQMTKEVGTYAFYE
jgi:hypothetical protein